MITCFFEDSKSKAYLRHVTVDAIIVKGSKILLVKRVAHTLEGGKYALPGGFLNRNESLKEGMAREVKEETGYEAKKAALFRINDNPDRRGEDRQNIDFVFLVKVGGKISEFDNEVTKVEWFDLANLPNESDIAFDHYENIKLYLKYRKRKFNLPVSLEKL